MGTRTRFRAFLLCLLLAAGCQMRSGSGFQNNSDDSPFKNSNSTDPMSGLDLGASKSGSTVLTDADKQGLNNLFQDANSKDLAPSDPSKAVSDAYQTQINKLLDAQRRGQEVQAQLMAVAGQMLADCSKRAAQLAPIPGQTLLGTWGTDKTQQVVQNKFASAVPAKQQQDSGCSVRFSIQGAPPLTPQTTNKYEVTGETNGSMVADTNGIGVVQANPWSGNLRDTPQAGNGVLRNPNFVPATGGKNSPSSCDANVVLVTSANPIPANYNESVERLGCCFRQALMIMSPTMVDLMANTDPRLAAILVQGAGCVKQ